MNLIYAVCALVSCKTCYFPCQQIKSIFTEFFLYVTCILYIDCEDFLPWHLLSGWSAKEILRPGTLSHSLVLLHFFANGSLKSGNVCFFISILKKKRGMENCSENMSVKNIT